MIKFVPYLLVGIVHSFLLAKLWASSAKGNYTAAFFLSLCTSTAAFINIRLAAENDIHTFATYALGQALGIAYGVYHNKRK